MWPDFFSHRRLGWIFPLISIIKLMRLASLGLGRFFFHRGAWPDFFPGETFGGIFIAKKHHIPWMINGPPLKVYFKLYPVLKLILTSICYCIIKLSISSSLCSTLQTWMIVLHRRSLRYLNLRFWGFFFFFIQLLLLLLL